MNNITDVKIVPMPDSIYLKPIRMEFKHNGLPRTWDMTKVHDRYGHNNMSTATLPIDKQLHFTNFSVAIIIYNTTRDVLILVKQFRPGKRHAPPFKTIRNRFRNVSAVYFGGIPNSEAMDTIDTIKYPPDTGITLELCAGIIDKQISWQEIAKEEVLEECGYDVPLSNIHKVASYRSGVGHSGSVQLLYYCEVTDDMKTTSGGGVDDEMIEVIEMSVADIKKYVTQEHILSPPSFLFGIYWFLQHKQK